MSSKEVIENPEEGTISEFELQTFTDAVDAKEGKKRDRVLEFKPQFETIREKEFVLGGFDFEYTHGYRADEIKKKTTDEIEKMIADAKEEVSGIEKEAHDKGHKKGHDKGRQDGFKEMELALKSFKDVTAELIEAREDFFHHAEKEMIDLLVIVASEIIGKEIKEDSTIITNVIRKSVKEITSKQRVVIRLNPIDLEIAQNVSDKLIKETENLEGVEFKTDESISEGGCVIETNIGDLDGTVESRLASIFRNLKNEIRG